MLQKLEFIIALAREKHFGRAAASCGVAQPTLSQGIQQLEEMFNVPLVKRSSRFQGFTPEGERVLSWARRLVGDAQAMRQEISGLQQGVGAHIRLAAVPSAMPLVASLTTPFQLRNPTVRFTVLMRNSDELISLLHQREIDIGVTYIDNDPLGEVIKVPLFREGYLLLTTQDGPLGRSEKISWRQLPDLPLCMLTRELQQRRIIDGILNSLGTDISPKIETDSLAALISHVQTGQWVSVIPSSVAGVIDASGSMCTVPIGDPDVFHTIGLVASKLFPIQPTITALIEDARHHNDVTGPYLTQ